MKFNQLKRLKEVYDTIPKESPNANEILSNLDNDIDNNDHKALLRKIENSRIVYNQKEPIVIAMKRAFLLANKFFICI